MKSKTNEIELDEYEKIFQTFIYQEMQNDPAHDAQHIFRVVKTAKQIGIEEQANLNIVVPAAYLHDCYLVPKNSELRSKASQLSAQKAINYLLQIDYDEQYYDAIYDAILSHSFSANIAAKTLEAKVLQDADRLDALGAIGISRLMQTSALFNSQIYHPQDPFCNSREPDDKSFAIDHFYAKLFHLNKQLNTNSAKAKAQSRFRFMHQFLNQLDTEI